MPNVAIAALLTCVVMIGSANAASPLPPGGAAGVKQAQGTDWGGPLLGAAVTGGIFLALLLLVDSDDTGPVTSTTLQ